MAEFVRVAKTGEIANGQMQAFDVKGQRVAVARVGESFYGFGDVCTHAQCSLADGTLEGTTVTCPCHGSQFDVRSGAVLAPPAREPVGSHRVRVQGEEIQVEV